MEVFVLNIKYINGGYGKITVAKETNKTTYDEIKAITNNLIKEQLNNNYDLDLTEIENELINNYGFYNVDEIYISF